jgi:hypothetical protein
MNSKDRNACFELRSDRHSYNGIDAVYMYWRELGVNVRTAKSLAVNEIKTVEQLQNESLINICRLPNVGASSVAQLHRFANWPLDASAYFVDDKYHSVTPAFLDKVKQEIKFGLWKHK